MKIHDLIQGSPEWLAHRSQHFNASDAPAMMGCSPYKTRTELLHELKTGIVPEVDNFTQDRFAEGHRIETLARPLAEEIIGGPLYPVTGTNGELSASFDGLTMAEDIGFEHKTLNEELRSVMSEQPELNTGHALPLKYRVQMEQQLAVSGADEVLFMATKWDGDTLVEQRHCFYQPDLALRQQIIDGWKQFAADLATFVPVEVLPAAVAAPVIALPAVSVVVNGALAVTSNFDLFEKKMREYIAGLPKKPSTDQEFADAESAIKILGDAEGALKAAVNSAVGQTATLDQVCRTGDMLRELARTARLALEKLVTDRKAAIRLEIIQTGAQAFANHMAALNERLGRPYMPVVPTDFPGAIKGKRTVESLQNAVNTELARAKIAASAIADKIDTNLKTLRELAVDHGFLFNDVSTIVHKANDDLTVLVKSRIAEHKASEDAKEEATRQRIRQEELDKIAADAKALADAAAVTPATTAPPLPQTLDVPEVLAIPVATGARQMAPRIIPKVIQESAQQTSTPALNVGMIAELLGFQLPSTFISVLGFDPAAKIHNSVLYHETDFVPICKALIEHIETVCETAENHFSNHSKEHSA